MQRKGTPPTKWERRARTVPLGTYVSTAGGLVVIVAAVFSAVRAADRVETSVESLTTAVVDLKRTTGDLAISTHGTTSALEDVQAHLRDNDASLSAHAARLDALERYLLIHPPAGIHPIPQGLLRPGGAPPAGP